MYIQRDVCIYNIYIYIYVFHISIPIRLYVYKFHIFDIRICKQLYHNEIYIYKYEGSYEFTMHDPKLLANPVTLANTIHYVHHLCTEVALLQFHKSHNKFILSSSGCGKKNASAA